MATTRCEPSIHHYWTCVSRQDSEDRPITCPSLEYGLISYLYFFFLLSWFHSFFLIIFLLLSLLLINGWKGGGVSKRISIVSSDMSGQIEEEEEGKKYKGRSKRCCGLMIQGHFIWCCCCFCNSVRLCPNSLQTVLNEKKVKETMGVVTLPLATDDDGRCKSRTTRQ